MFFERILVLGCWGLAFFLIYTNGHSSKAIEVGGEATLIWLAWTLWVTWVFGGRLSRSENRCRSVVPVKKKLGMLIPKLFELRTELGAICALKPLVGIVQFFNEVSVWQDRLDEIDQIIVALQRADRSQHSELIQKLEVLRKHFQNAGRDRYGWNRTEKGQTVTADKVFLGNIYGLFTHPVSFWMDMKDEPKGRWKGGVWDGCSAVDDKNSYDVVSEQARGFMTSHIKPMCEVIDWLSETRKVKAA